jgi:hypothetical protein
MSDVISVVEASNSIVNVSEVKTAKGDLVVKLTREYGVVASPEEIMAFEQALLQFSAALMKAD